MDDHLAEFLFHKVPFEPNLEEDGPPVVTTNPDFDLENMLRIACSANTPPASPVFAPLEEPGSSDPLEGWPNFGLSNDPDPSTSSMTCPVTPSCDSDPFGSLFSLSPLSSPEDDGDVEYLNICQVDSPSPSRPSSPQLSAQTSLRKDGVLPDSQCSERENVRDKGSRFAPLPPESMTTGSTPPAAIPTEPRPMILSEAPSPLPRKRRRRAQNHQNRRESRRNAREQAFSHYQSRPNAPVHPGPVIRTAMDTESGSAAAAAFVGLNDGSGEKRLRQLSHFIGKGSKNFGYVAWDGKLRRSVTDALGRKVVFLAGQPQESDWPLLMKQAANTLESRRSCLSIPKGGRVHRRGAFPAVRCGVSHGGGSTCPGNLKNEDKDAAVVGELVGMDCFKRLAGFASSVMSWQAPKIFAYYLENLAELHKRHPHLKRLFPSSVFAAASFNFGPRTACFKHKDFANLPFGLCAVTALGSFDPRKGGHLILWELKLIIEFPPGSTILLPSAIIAHSNVPVQKDEHRYSFAQYTAGGIFRWVQNDCKLTKDYYATLSPEELESQERKDSERWQLGLSLFERDSSYVC